MGSVSRLAFLRSQYVISHAPGVDSVFWLPARAALGDGGSLAVVLIASIVLFWAVIARYAPRFTDYALVAAGTSDNGNRRQRGGQAFRVRRASSALRLKERRLLLRDPWLISQTLMQLLYLFPPALLLWHSIGAGTGASIILVPVLIMTAGQLAGGLAWLAVSGEDAPDLVMSAPVTMRALLRAKTEVVMQCVGVVLFPFVASLALISARQAFFVVIGSAAAAASSTAIQIWFRSQAKRSQFRRRHTSSRIATLSEALVSIAWAAAGTVSALSIWLAAILAVVALVILACVRALSPERRHRNPQPVMRLRVAPHETSS
jgi:ABC-2 type transport system permease protein